jgi:hypothetical protein
MGIFALLLIALPVSTSQWPHIALQAFAAFYQAEALVFGDGYGCCRCCKRPIRVRHQGINSERLTHTYKLTFIGSSAFPGPF